MLTFANSHACTFILILPHIHTNTFHTYMHTLYMYTLSHICICILSYMHKYTLTHIHTFTLTYTHTLSTSHIHLIYIHTFLIKHTVTHTPILLNFCLRGQAALVEA